jgi:hypothetical protein
VPVINNSILIQLAVSRRIVTGFYETQLVPPTLVDRVVYCAPGNRLLPRVSATGRVDVTQFAARMNGRHRVHLGINKVDYRLFSTKFLLAPQGRL